MHDNAFYQRQHAAALEQIDDEAALLAHVPDREAEEIAWEAMQIYA